MILLLLFSASLALSAVKALALQSPTPYLRPQLHIDLPANRMIRCRHSKKGTGAKPMVMHTLNDIVIHKGAGIPKFAFSDCACCPV